MRRWVHEDFSRRLHLFTLVGLWSPVLMLSLWRSPPGPQFAWLVVIEPVLVIVPTLVALGIARRLGYDRKRATVLAIAAGLSNVGFTLGGFVAYALLNDAALLPPWIDAAPGGEPLADAAAGRQTANAALSYAIAQVTVMSVLAVVVMYPLAIRAGEHAGDRPSMATLMRRSFLDVRAAQLYAAVIGAALGWSGVPFPEAVDAYRVLDVLMFAGAGGAYAGIGLRLHAGHTLRAWRAHALLGAFQFAAAPLLVAAVIAAFRATGVPQPPLVERVLLINAFTATAIQTVIIANLFHLDTRLASGLWVVNTAACLVVPMPLLVWWFG